MGLIALAVFAGGFARGQESPPIVQMVVPGFTVHELPIRLSNINNIRFAPDGILTALGYDGRVHLLRDTTGDGLEDTAEIFWDEPTLRVPVGMAWSEDGLYVSSQGKVSLLRDTTGDGKADTEDIIADGWPRTDVASGGVDATAVTLDDAGNIYFGLLTANYANPYRVKDGVSHYDIKSVRGTIQRIPAGTRDMQTLVTGIRVPFTLAFNRHGDLFVTDQEGETWLPGGNPLDELHHIIPGRHYGFPPRHEEYLPDVIDEPPVVAIGPQHQSTCGFFFNEPGLGQRSFGPAWWENDAIMTGQSRGKLWRTRLVKTPSGYVGRETLFASLTMLTVDVALSPQGDLYVTCHSGRPDWGTGPKGEGKLFKISYTDPKAPQPVMAWAAGPMEVRVAFDRPVGLSITNRLPEIEFGQYVRAADRYEVLKPPYKTVQEQALAPRGQLNVVSARLSPDQKTLILATDPHPQSVYYAVTIHGVQPAGDNDVPPSGGEEEGVTVDLAYELSGVHARWRAAAGPGEEASNEWAGWLPHVAFKVSRAFTEQSATHRRLYDLAANPGSLRLETQLKLPPGQVTVRLQHGAAFKVEMGNNQARSSGGVVELAVDAKEGELIPMSVEVETGAADPALLHASYFTDKNPNVRPLPFEFLLLPWAPPHTPPPLRPATAEMDLAGGSFQRGKNLFFGDQLQCAACHRIRGEGRENGPDLSNLIHRDAASVLHDIVEPSATINPDYVAYWVDLVGGESLFGFLRAHGEDKLRVTDAAAEERLVPREEVRELRPSPISLMPEGLLEGLTEGQIRDLLTFLLHEPPQRTRRDLKAVLQPLPKDESQKELNIVLVAGRQDHGPGEHDYPACQQLWHELLEAAPSVRASKAWEWPTGEQFTSADVIVCYFWNRNWTDEQYEQLDRFLERGGGLVMLHSATIANTAPERLAERIGLSAQPGRTKYLHAPFDLVVQRPDHPLMAGFPQTIYFLDEPYWPMIGDMSRVTVLAGAEQEGELRPMLWTFERENGRVFGSIVGHYTWTHEDPFFQLLVLRGIAWAGGEPVGRFESLMVP